MENTTNTVNAAQNPATNVSLLAEPRGDADAAIEVTEPTLNVSSSGGEGTNGQSGAEEITGPPFRARLPQGQIELVALAPNPSTNQSWWRPDGTRLADYGFDDIHLYHSPEVKNQFELAFRSHGLPNDMSLDFIFDPKQMGTSGPWHPVRHGRKLKDHNRLVVSLPKSAEQVDVKVGVAAGAWKTMSGRTPQAGSGTAFQLGAQVCRAVFHDPVEVGTETRVGLSYNKVAGWEARITALDTNGQLHVSFPHGLSMGDMASLEGRFPDLPLARVREFRLEMRPFEYVEFRNVTLEPGRQTRVAVVHAAGMELPAPAYLLDMANRDPATILRRYAEEVWTKVLPRMESVEVNDIPEKAAELASDIAQRLLLPHQDVIAPFMLEQLPVGKPLDPSQWQVTLSKSASTTEPLGMRRFWNPITVVQAMWPVILSKKVGTEGLGKWKILETFAPVPQVLVEAHPDRPIFTTPCGDSLLMAWLERDADGQYRCTRVEWLDKKPGATQHYWLAPPDASMAQGMMLSYSVGVWLQLWPEISSKSILELAREARQMAEVILVPRSDILRKDAQAILEQLPKAAPVDRTQWHTRMAHMDQAKSVSEVQAALNLSELGSAPLCWDPVRMVERIRLAAFLRLENPESLARRAAVQALAGAPLHTVADAHPQHPQIVTRNGNELTIVRLRQDATGRYELEHFEWLILKMIK